LALENADTKFSEASLVTPYGLIGIKALFSSPLTLAPYTDEVLMWKNLFNLFGLEALTKLAVASKLQSI
jgi:hypothetical protein